MELHAESSLDREQNQINTEPSLWIGTGLSELREEGTTKRKEVVHRRTHKSQKPCVIKLGGTRTHVWLLSVKD